MLSAHSGDPLSLMGRGTASPTHSPAPACFIPHTLTAIDPRATRPWSYSGPFPLWGWGGGVVVLLVLSALKYVSRCRGVSPQSLRTQSPW